MTAIANCLTHTSATTCAQCSTGFRKSTTNNDDTCVEGIADCVIHDPAVATSCSQCVEGHSKTVKSPVSNDICSLPIVNCKTYGASLSLCLACDETFVVKKGSNGEADKCVQTIANCKTYTSEIVCGTCIAGFAYTPGASGVAGTCDAMMANCKTFDTDGKCKQCATGYYFSADKLKCNQGQQGSSAGISYALSVGLFVFVAILK